ncbi:lymphatic vessel endothelial hyaluronic receptor 1b [Centroberyx gerrardi]
MARVWLFAHFLFLSFAGFALAFDSSQIKAVPKSGRTAGVFIIPKGGDYIFNLTEARAACLFLNVTIATKAQMEKALQHGLQTCRYGWIDEQIAVIPRLTADPKCGKNKTALVPWNANVDRKFGAFCFNAADLEKTPKTAAGDPGTSKSSTALTRAPSSVSSPVRSKPNAPSSRKSTTKAPKPAPRTPAFTLLVKSTHSTRLSSTFPPLKSTSSTPPPPPPPSHSVTSSTSAAHFTSSASVHASASSVSSPSLHTTTTNNTAGSVLLQSVGAVPTALIVLGVILLVLTAAGVVWYYRLSIFPFWSRQQKDDIETEMWKHTDSEMDLHSRHEGEEEADRKYSSDVTLCVNPDIKTNSSE